METTSTSCEILEKLEEKLGCGVVVSQSRGEWKFPCPVCGIPKRVLVSIPKGVFMCVTPGCKYSGRLSSLLRIKRIVAPPPVSIDTAKVCAIHRSAIEAGTLRPTHRDWLLSRGLNPWIVPFVSSDGILSRLQELFSVQDLLEAGLMVSNGVKHFASRVISPGMLLIPYYDPSTLEVCYLRARDMNPEAKVRYLSPAKVPASHLSWGWQLLSTSLYSIIVTEGEFKALSAIQLGFQCIAIPGISTGHRQVAKLCAERGVKTVYILFDTDTTYSGETPKQAFVDCAASRLAGILLREGIKVFGAHLPPIAEKVDLDSFLMASDNPEEDLRQVLAEATPYRLPGKTSPITGPFVL